MDFGNVIPGIVVIAGGAFVVLLIILWVCLPFAVFGVKDKLDDILAELKRINARSSPTLNSESKPAAPPTEKTDDEVVFPSLTSRD